MGTPTINESINESIRGENARFMFVHRITEEDGRWYLQGLKKSYYSKNNVSGTLQVCHDFGAKTLAELIK